jgi:hypothetical protein
MFRLSRTYTGISSRLRLLQFYRSCSLASSQLRAFDKISLRRPLLVRLAALAAGPLNRSLELVCVYFL